MKRKNIIKKTITILIIAVLVSAQASTVAAFSWSFSSKSETAVAQKEEDISDYEEYLTQIQDYISNLDTSDMSLDDTKVEIFDYVEELQEQYSDTSGVDYVTNQILSKMLQSSATESSSLTSSLSSTVSSLLGDTSISLESLTPDEVITIQATSAGDFAGNDYNVTLSGNIYKADTTSNKWVVLVQGFMMTGQAMADALGQMYLNQGYNIFALDSRGFGNSEGEVGMGYMEMLDTWDWLTYLNANYDCDGGIIVHGVSLGGATVLYLSGYEDENGKTLEDQNVIGLVDDCGYTSMVGIVQDLINTVGNNELIGKILSIVNLDLDGLSDYDTLKEYLMSSVAIGFTEGDGHDFDTLQDAMNSLSKCSLPILIIHGTEDSIVPYENSNTVYNTAYANTNIPYIQRFSADGEEHAFIVMGTKANVYEGHIDNFIETVEDIANGKTVNRLSDYEEEEEESTSFITKLVNAIKLIKNMFGF